MAKETHYPTKVCRRQFGTNGGWLTIGDYPNATLRQIDGGGIVGGRRLELHVREGDEQVLYRTMHAIDVRIGEMGYIVAKGFVSDDEDEFVYKYHIEEWAMQVSSEK